MRPVGLNRRTIALFSRSLPTLPSPLIAIKRSSSGIPSIRLCLQITCQSLWCPSFVPPSLLKPPLALMHLTDALASKPADLGLGSMFCLFSNLTCRAGRDNRVVQLNACAVTCDQRMASEPGSSGRFIRFCHESAGLAAVFKDGLRLTKTKKHKAWTDFSLSLDKKKI